MRKTLAPAPEVELIFTDDGSHTLYVPRLNEHYHSVFGAMAESRHIFLEAGYKFQRGKSENIHILEVGFGTGLNALLTLLESFKDSCCIEYSSIELYPLPESVYNKLNYAELINCPGAKEYFLRMHSLPWNEKIRLANRFLFQKILTSLDDYKIEKQEFDLVFFDAFGPDVQPEMWTIDIFKKLSSGLKAGGILVTYSTKGLVKRNLIEAGFKIEKLPGPPGKREILRGILP